MKTQAAGGGKCSSTDLVVNLAGGHGGVAEVFGVAVGQVEAAGGGDAIGRVIDAAGPAGVVVDAAAAQLGSQREETGERQMMRWKSNGEKQKLVRLFLSPVSKICCCLERSLLLTGELNL